MPERTPETVKPHDVLPTYYGDPAERRPFVARLFDQGARHYERINGWMSFGTGARYRREALERGGLKPGMRALDVATGTGVVARGAREIVGESGRVVGLDPSAGMLREAGRLAPLTLVRAFAEALPFREKSFDFLSMGYALRHVADLGATFAEYHRVLRPGGRLVVLEIVRPANPLVRAGVRFYLKRLVPWLASVRSHDPGARTMMEYFWDTIEACVPPQTILDALRGAAFTDVEQIVEFGSLAAYQARRPD